jgi:hypothetical protein
LERFTTNEDGVQQHARCNETEAQHLSIRAQQKNQTKHKRNWKKKQAEPKRVDPSGQVKATVGTQISGGIQLG